MSRHIILKIMVLPVLFGLAVPAAQAERSDVATADKSVADNSAAEEPAPVIPVTLQLKWTHQFQFAGYYAAIEQGFYRNAGFEVTLRERTDNLDPIQEVTQGRADYGVADAQLVYYRMQGEPV